MRFDPEIFSYLKGSAFSNGLAVAMAEKNEPLTDRVDFIVELCRGKKIIHLGCVDHIPLIRDKMKQDQWLHARLSAAASRCFGIDINAGGIEYLKKEFGYTDLLCADIVRDEIGEIENEHWDYLVLGEILEHINDPCSFLSAIRTQYSSRIDRLLITVPNAFSWQNITYTFAHQECINTDHRYWFTPFTLGKIVTLAGMTVEEFAFCQPFSEDHRLKTLLRHPKIMARTLIMRRMPATRQTLVMVAAL